VSELSPHDLIASYEGRAGLLARCILFGLVEPDVEIDPNVMMTLAYTIVDELRTTAEETPGRFGSRAEKALQWAVRSDVAPEAAAFMVQMLINDPMTGPALAEAETMQGAAWIAFNAQFKDILFG
jgi:hypothetical protein